MVFSVYVPCPAIVTTPSASQAAGLDAGVMRHVAEVFKPAAAVARPEVPVIVVKVAVPPGITDCDSGVATGAAGAVTLAVMVAVVS